MTEILTLEEMKERYDGKWLLIAYTNLDEQMRVISGEVLIHSNSRDEVYKSLYLGKGRNVAIECFAKVPEDLAFIV